MFEGSEHYGTKQNKRGLTAKNLHVILRITQNRKTVEFHSPKLKGLWRCYNDRSLSRT